MTINTSEFWQKENELLWGDLDEVSVAALLAGGSGGLALLPDNVLSLVDMELFAQGTIEYLQGYRQDLAGINDTTRKQIALIIQAWLLSGEDLGNLEAQLQMVLSDSRASQIAISEITKLFAVGNLLLWQTTGTVLSKQWTTARDERVCPLCGPLDGQIVDIDFDFGVNTDLIANSPQMRLYLKRYTQEAGQRSAKSLLRNVGSQWPHPPAHPNCRCYLQPVFQDVTIGDILFG